MRGGSGGADRLVYLMRPIGMLGPVKIGCSEVPLKRLAALAAWSPFPLEVVASFPGSFALERNLHECFAEYHLHREWFHPTPEVLDFVSKIVAGLPVEKAVDLQARSRERYRKNRSRKRPQRLRAYMSYFHRTRYAVLRAERELGERRWRPDGVYCTLELIKREKPVSEDQLAEIEAFIADPVKLAVTWEQLYPEVRYASPAPDSLTRADEVRL